MPTYGHSTSADVLFFAQIMQTKASTIPNH